MPDAPPPSVPSRSRKSPSPGPSARDSWSSPARKFSPQPRTCQRKLAIDGSRRDPQNFGRLLHRHSREVAHFHNLRLLGIEMQQPVQDLIHGQDLFQFPGARIDLDPIQPHYDRPCSALVRQPRPGVIHQHAAHHLGRDPEEMSAIPPVDLRLIRQSKPRFVDQRCRLESVSWTLTPHEGASDAPKFPVDQPDQLVRRIDLAALGLSEQDGYFPGQLLHGFPPAHLNSNSEPQRVALEVGTCMRLTAHSLNLLSCSRRFLRVLSRNQIEVPSEQTDLTWPAEQEGIRPRRTYMKPLFAILSLLLLAAIRAGAQPSISPGGVVNAASYIRSEFPNSGIAQGSLFIVFGRDLGPGELRTFEGLPKPKTLAGTSVRVSAGGDTVDAYLYYTSATQVAAILPSNTPLGAGTVTVTHNNVASAPMSVRVVRSAPGIFTRNQVGHGQAILQNVASPTAWPLNEPTEAAQPGSAAILWGTGLGPIEADDAGSPPVGNVSADVEVLVGNRPVRPFYYGRSGDFPGIDQINFLVPAGVEGCRVPVAVRVDGVVGNYASMAITSSGKTCSDPVSLPAVDMERLRRKQDGTVAWITLNRFSASLGGVSIRQDDGKGEVVRGDLSGMLASGALAGPGSMPALGTCTVYALPEPGSSMMMEPVHPDYRQAVDAGPALSVSGPQGQKYMFRRLKGEYEATLGGGTLPEYLLPGTYRVDNGRGGAGLGSFQAELNLPPPLVWTNEAQISEVPRTADLTVTWSGGDPGREFVFIGGVSVNHASKVQASFLCSERVTAGRFVIPATVLSSLPASSEWTGAGLPSALGLGTQPLMEEATFTASGLDLGLFRYLDATLKSVHYR